MSYPVTIDSTNFIGYSFGGSPLGQFVFQHGSAVYAFLLQNGVFGPPDADFAIHCFKSTDTGLTWTEMDAANAPVINNGSAYAGSYTAMVDGNTCVFIAPAGSGTPFVATGTKLYTFNLSTDLWALSGVTPTNDIVPSGDTRNSTLFSLHLVRRGTGDYVLLYSGAPFNSGGTLYMRMWEVTFNGAAYGTPAQIPDQAGTVRYYPCGAVVDGGGTTHFVYHDDSFVGISGDFSIFHIAMGSGGGFGATGTVSQLGWNPEPFGVSIPIIYTIAAVDYIALGGICYTADIANAAITVFSAVVSATPTWTPTEVVIDTSALVPSTPYDNYFPDQLVAMTETAGTVTLAWALSKGIGTPGGGIQQGSFYTMTTTAGNLSSGWTAPALLFAPPTEIWIFDSHQIAVCVLTGGVGVLGNSLQSTRGGLGEISQFSVLVESSPPSVICDSPPNGTTGIAYTHTFPASGGTPPYVFSIVGGVLPPGLTLNTSTGVVSGSLTTTGTFSFTIQVIGS